jgi:hypothetical protein
MDDEIKKMWTDGLNEMKSQGDDKICFEEFKSFLKGRVPKEALLSTSTSTGN